MPRTPDIRPLVIQNLTKHFAERGVADPEARAEELVNYAETTWADLIQGSDPPADLPDL